MDRNIVSGERLADLFESRNSNAPEFHSKVSYQLACQADFATAWDGHGKKPECAEPNPVEMVVCWCKETRQPDNICLEDLVYDCIYNDVFHRDGSRPISCDLIFKYSIFNWPRCNSRSTSISARSIIRPDIALNRSRSSQVRTRIVVRVPDILHSRAL